MELRKNVIITAGGSGLRMGADVPKQFLLLKGKPLVFRTIETFSNLPMSVELYVVIPALYFDLWRELAAQHQMSTPCTLVSGGFTRFHSVKNALALIPSGGITAVHDGVRPLVTQEMISSCFDLAKKHPAVVPTMEITESMRQTLDQGFVPVDRALFRTVQTPQVFWTDVLKEAYNQSYDPSFTDDASVVEKNGTPLFQTKGIVRNIKITTPEELQMAEVLW